ncbi:YbaY family lipoprotein [Pseudomonas sp. GZD-222]|uniref:YbaY family lipoprotein n=1 Tax=Pseudomonas sp. GZD-222 TaxID=3404805 RepID=UPI003BB55BF9
MPKVDYQTLDVTLLFAVTRLGLPSGVTVTLTLADISRADAPAITLAEQTLLAGPEIGFDFNLRYDSRMVDERMTYALMARIVHEDNLLLLNTSSCIVKLDGTQNEVTMNLDHP